MYSMKEIKNLYKKEINIFSGEEEYIYKNIIITKHSIKRFIERINNNIDIYLALIIIEYENIIDFINKNIDKLEEGEFIEYKIKYQDIKFRIIIRKCKYNKDKYVIKTVKIYNYLDYKINKYKSQSIFNIN